MEAVMANLNWKVWLVPFGFWGLYLCWYSGYQSGYADGHETAWDMARPNLVLAAINEPPREFREMESLRESEGIKR